MQFYVEPRGAGAVGRPARPVGPKTPVTAFTEPTFVAPVTDPGGAQQLQEWSAISHDGRWRYDREPGDNTPWTVTYLPTGQVRDWFANLDDAREQTAGPLLSQLRGEAYLAAFHSTDADQRAVGQRWLAVHMRLAGATNVDARCGCGGLLAVSTGDGRYAHVDACDTCKRPGPQPCATPAQHRFCADPDPRLSDLELQVLDFERRRWNQPGAKEDAIRRTFPGLSTTRYYQLLNSLLDNPAALAAEPVLVNRLRRLRASRTRKVS